MTQFLTRGMTRDGSPWISIQYRGSKCEPLVDIGGRVHCAGKIDKKFCSKAIAKTYPTVGKACPQPQIFYLFSYRYTFWASTELVKIYPTSPKKSDFHKP
jgi:hypothetical protein